MSTTYRPVGARIVAYGVAVVGAAVTGSITLAMPDSVVWTPAQLGTLAVIGLGMLVALHGIGRSFVAVDDEGLTIVNGYRRHRLAWSDVKAVVMKRGAPWPTAILNGPDEPHVILFALQGSDGEVARRVAGELAARIPQVSHRSLAEPAFPDDDGRIAPALAEALGDDAAVFAVIGGVRVFVPIVAVLGERATDGSDKSADMAAVFMTGADGRKALLAFSSVAAMEQWDPTARPVPVWGRDAAASALDEGASALLLDLGSPHYTVIELVRP